MPAIGAERSLQDAADILRRSQHVVALAAGRCIRAPESPVMAKREGAPLIEVNPEETPLTSISDATVRAPAGVSLPAVVDLLREM